MQPDEIYLGNGKGWAETPKTSTAPESSPEFKVAPRFQAFRIQTCGRLRGLSESLSESPDLTQIVLQGNSLSNPQHQESIGPFVPGTATGDTVQPPRSTSTFPRNDLSQDIGTLKSWAQDFSQDATMDASPIPLH